jgi:hypothetical protein
MSIIQSGRYAALCVQCVSQQEEKATGFDRLGHRSQLLEGNRVTGLILYRDR